MEAFLDDVAVSKPSKPVIANVTGQPVTDAKLDIWIRVFHRAETDANGFYWLKKIDQDGINDGIFNVVQTAGSREIRVAGGYATGSILTGSTLGPDDLSDCKATMSTGSNIYMPDTVLMHPTQYNQLVQSSDFQSAVCYEICSRDLA